MEKPEQLSSPTGWTDAQWEKVYQTVSEEANKASVAGAFLPCYGPLSRSAEGVRGEKLEYIENGDYLKVDDAKTIDLWIYQSGKRKDSMGRRPGNRAGRKSEPKCGNS